MQEVTIATQLLLQQQKSLAAVVVLYCYALQKSISVVQQTFVDHPQWPPLFLRPIPVDTTLEPFQFDLFTNTLYTEIRGWLDGEYQIHLLLASECKAMTILGMSVAQLLLGTEDHIWHLHKDNILHESNQVLLFDGDQAQLIEIHFPRLMYIPISFTRFMYAESMHKACVKLAEEQQRNLRYFVANELTRAEREIATLIATGMTNEEISKQLGVERKTIQGHITNIYYKLEEKFALQSNRKLKRKFLQTKLQKWLSP